MTENALSLASADCSPSELVAAGRAFRAGSADLDALLKRLGEAHLYALRPARPGLLVLDHSRAGRWVVVFGSLRGLAAFAVERGWDEVSWMSMTGTDLLQSLPAGVGLLLDPPQPHAVALPSNWLEPHTARPSHA